MFYIEFSRLVLAPGFIRVVLELDVSINRSMLLFCVHPRVVVRGQRVYLGWLCTSFRRARLVAYEDTLLEAGDCIRLMLNFPLGGTALWWLENSRWSLYMRHVPSLMRLPRVWTLRILAAGLTYF